QRGVRLRRSGLARVRVPRRFLLLLRRSQCLRRLPGLLLSLPDGAPHAAHRGVARLRRRRQLVGHHRRARPRLLPQAARCAPPLARHRLPVLEAALLERPAADLTLRSAREPNAATYSPSMPYWRSFFHSVVRLMPSSAAALVFWPSHSSRTRRMWARSR